MFVTKWFMCALHNRLIWKINIAISTLVALDGLPFTEEYAPGEDKSPRRILIGTSATLGPVRISRGGMGGEVDAGNFNESKRTGSVR